MTSAVKVAYGSSDELEASDDFLILSHQDDVESGIRRGDVDSSRWNGRGWTMQERSLSTRLIYFCSNNIYFECRESLASESNEPESFETFHSFQLWPRNNSSETPAEKLFQQWRKAVVEYSHRQLTRAFDKLPAIQSIANEMMGHVPGTYIAFAGMWEDDIRSQLLWYVERGNRVRLPEYRAPTWSWASLEVYIGFLIGSVGTHELEKTLLHSCPDNFQLIGFDNEYHNQPALKNYIELKGLAKVITRIIPIDGSDYWLSMDRGSFPYNVFGESSPGNRGVLFAHGQLDLDNWDNLLSTTRQLVYFHILNDQQPSGLILEKASAELQGSTEVEIWTRVGVATIFYGPDNSGLGEIFEEIGVIII